MAESRSKRSRAAALLSLPADYLAVALPAKPTACLAASILEQPIARGTGARASIDAPSTRAAASALTEADRKVEPSNI